MARTKRLACGAASGYHRPMDIAFRAVPGRGIYGFDLSFDEVIDLGVGPLRVESRGHRLPMGLAEGISYWRCPGGLAASPQNAAGGLTVEITGPGAGWAVVETPAAVG